MQIFSLCLVGAPIENTFIYRTSLYCWTFEKRLRIYAVADLETAAAAQDAERSQLINYILFHSKGFGASPDQLFAWHNWQQRHEEDSVDNPALVIDGEAVPHIEVNVRVDGDALLDMLMYYNRLYLATNGGLYSVEPFDAADPPVGFLDADRKVSDACYSASAGLGTIAASCGPKGLRLFFDDLRWASASKPTEKSIRGVRTRQRLVTAV